MSIEVHHSTFSEDSMITTSNGVYQVQGAVSAQKGDVVKLRQYDNARVGSLEHEPHICIASTIRPRCYYVL